jgi:hypothetical protein
MVERQFPWGGEVSNLKACLTFSTQAQSCTKHGDKWEIRSPEMMRPSNSLAAFFSINGQYDKSIAQYERGLEIKEKALGVDHINTANTIMGLGLTFHSQGNTTRSHNMNDR